MHACLLGASVIDPTLLPGTYIRFRDITRLYRADRKTQVIIVEAKYGDLSLGKIAWHPRWRRYTFFPHEDTVFEALCLSEITHALSLLMEDRAAQRGRP